MEDNRLIMIDDALYSQRRINYIESDLIDKANDADDRQEIELLKKQAIFNGLGELAEQIEQIWIARQEEMLEAKRNDDEYGLYAAGAGVLCFYAIIFYLIFN